MVKEYWDTISSIYDLFSGLYLGCLYNELIDEILLRVRSQDTVLELAAGTGIVTHRLTEKCAHVFAVDISKKMLFKLKEKRLEHIVKIANMDAESLGFKNNSFDKVICVNGLHVFRDPVLALKEIKRVLKKGGYVISATFCYGDVRAMGFKIFLLLSGWFWISGGIPPYLRQFDICSLLSIFQQAGFKVLSRKLLWQFPPFLYVEAFNF